jgi:hypothetical protein
VPVPQRVAGADLVVVGTVTTIEQRPVRTKGGAEYRVAVVKVDEALLGGGGLTHVKVGFVPLPGAPGAVPPGRPGGPRPPLVNRAPELQKGQEACFFLRPLAGESLYVAANLFDVVDRKSPTFAADVTEARRAGKLLADPAAGLQAKEGADRYLTAAMLVHRYSTTRPPGSKRVPVDAAQSKLILEGLAQGDFNQQVVGAYNAFHPQNIFYLLGATERDGWKPPADFRQAGAVMKRWLEDHADTFRVHKWAAE